MANNLIQIKRTSVSGRVANTTTLPNPGELALNMTDGIMYSTNGSSVFEIGANNTNVNVSGNLTVKSIVANGSLGTNGFVLTTNGSGVFWASASAGSVDQNGQYTWTNVHSFQANVILSSVVANNSLGTDGQVLTSNGSTVYWSTLPASPLLDSVTNTSILYAATANSVKTAYDAGITAQNMASNAYSNATSYADTKAGNAYSNAVATAASDASTKAGTAYSNATAYTDSRIIDSVTNTSTSYAASANSVKNAYDRAIDANTRAASAQTAATNAYSNAASYADTVAGTAYSNAVSYANTAAGTAYSNAVSAAATDASTKAGTAYSNAVATASADASSKAATAYSNATSYADTKAGTAYSNATVFASNASNINTGTLAEARLPYRMNQNVRTSDTVEFAGMTLTGNLVVSGNVNVIGANNLSVSDNMIYLNANNDITNPDIGITGNYNDGTYQHTGFFRDASDGVWKVFDSYLPEPDANVYIDTSNASFQFANFQANIVYAGNSTVYSVVNSTAFNTSTNTVIIGNNNSYFVANGNVGIGNSAPANKLSVNGTGYFSANLTTAQTASANIFLISGSNDYITPTTGVDGWYYANTFSVSAQDGEPRDLSFSSNGSLMYILGNSGDDVNMYTLSTPWDITSATYSNNFSIASQDLAATGLTFKPDGTAMYITGDTNNSVFQYTLGTAWDIGTASYASKSFSTATQDTNPQAVEFSSDGTKMFIVGDLNNSVFQYTLGTAWDVTTASYTSTLSVATYETVPQGIAFNSTGTKMYIVGTGFARLIEYDLGTAWTLSTATFSQFSVISNLGTYLVLGASGIYYSEAQGKAYISDYQNDAVFQLTANDSSTKLIGTKFVFQPDVLIQSDLIVDKNSRFNGEIRAAGAITTGSTLSVSSTTALGGAVGLTATTQNINAVSQTTGTINLGGASQTGAINIGRSTANQTLALANGVTASGSIKTIDIGTLGAAGSNTVITLGSSAGGGLFTVQSQNTYFTSNVSFAGTAYIAGLYANGSVGAAGEVLHSNGTAVYWATDDQGVTSVTAGSGLTGNITSTGTISVLANNGIIANATGVYVNSSYIATLAANSATYANSSVSNTFTVGTAAYFVSNGNFGIGTNAPSYKLHVSGDSAISGNVGIGVNPATDRTFYISETMTADATLYGQVNEVVDSNTSMTAARSKYATYSFIINKNQNKSSDGLTLYNSNYLSMTSYAYNGDPVTGGDARANLVEGVRGMVLQYANGANANTVSVARGVLGQVQTFGSGVITSAYGVHGFVGTGNSTVTGNVTNAYGVLSQIQSNTAATIGNGYLYYGDYTGSTTTTKYGVYLSGESINYFSGNVGIGAVSSGDKLVVTASANTNAGMTLYNTNTGTSTQAVLGIATSGATGLQLGQNYSTKNAFIYLSDAASLTLSTNAIASMTIAANNNVGIGTATPTYLFDLFNSTTSDYYAGRFLSTANATGTSVTHLRIEKGSGYGGTVGGYITQGVGSGLVFSTLNGGTLASAMWITNAGNTGIGNSAPISKLHVEGSILAASGASTANTVRNNGLRLWTDNAFGVDLHYGDTGSGQSALWATALYGRKSDTVAVRIGAYPASNTSQNTFSEYVTILNSGNVGIGNTAPDAKLKVQGTANITGVTVFGANVSGPGTTAYLDGFFIDCGVYT